MFGIITLITALSLAGTAAWFAIAGIMAIFAGNAIPALIMGLVIEVGKVVGVSWVYRNWQEKTKLKYVLLPMILIAMLLTSMGIFGFLSKAHIEQNAPVGNNTLKIERLDQRIDREEARIADAETVIQQLDNQVATLIEYDKISGPDGSRAVRERQQPQRNALNTTIDEAQNKIDTFEDEKLQLRQQLQELELEVGPIKYIAELVYENPENSLEDAVRMVIIAFIFVFDPMAIVLLMAANYTLMQNQKPKNDGDPTLSDRGSNDYNTDPPQTHIATGTGKVNIVPNAKTDFVPAKQKSTQHTATRRGKFVTNDRQGQKYKKIDDGQKD